MEWTAHTKNDKHGYRPSGSSAVHDTIESSAETPRSRTVDLDRFAFQRVELCVVTEEADDPEAPTEGLAYWHNPVISPGVDLGARGAQGQAPPADLSPEELDVRREHLRALGYVN